MLVCERGKTHTEETRVVIHECVSVWFARKAAFPDDSNKKKVPPYSLARSHGWVSG